MAKMLIKNRASFVEESQNHKFQITIYDNSVNLLKIAVFIAVYINQFNEIIVIRWRVRMRITATVTTASLIRTTWTSTLA